MSSNDPSSSSPVEADSENRINAVLAAFEKQWLKQPHKDFVSIVAETVDLAVGSAGESSRMRFGHIDDATFLSILEQGELREKWGDGIYAHDPAAFPDYPHKGRSGLLRTSEGIQYKEDWDAFIHGDTEQPPHPPNKALTAAKHRIAVEEYLKREMAKRDSGCQGDEGGESTPADSSAQPKGKNKHWRSENWVRDPADYPDLPSRSTGKWLNWTPEGQKYIDKWFRFMAGQIDEPPEPSSALSEGQLKIAQREHRRRQEKKDD